MKNPNEIEKIRKLCKHKSFLPGKAIARGGKMSEVFFMLKGNANCCKKACGAEPIDSLTIGEAFGDEVRPTNTCIATTHAMCLCLAHKHHGQLFEKANAGKMNGNAQSMSNATIEDFEIIRALGKGSFSTASLAKLAPARGNNVENKGLFALKCCTDKNSENSKAFKELIENEMRITNQLNNPFIVRSFGDFSNNANAHFILEALLGGDLHRLLNHKSKFAEDWVRFCAASVLHAYADMHSKNIVCRDLKPENLILTSRGCIKIIDFGLSKQLADDEKAYACCGTVSVKLIILSNF